MTAINHMLLERIAQIKSNLDKLRDDIVLLGDSEKIISTESLVIKNTVLNNKAVLCYSGSGIIFLPGQYSDYYVDGIQKTVNLKLEVIETRKDDKKEQV